MLYFLNLDLSKQIDEEDLFTLLSHDDFPLHTFYTKVFKNYSWISKFFCEFNKKTLIAIAYRYFIRWNTCFYILCFRIVFQNSNGREWKLDFRQTDVVGWRALSVHGAKRGSHTRDGGSASFCSRYVQDLNFRYQCRPLLANTFSYRIIRLNNRPNLCFCRIDLLIDRSSTVDRGEKYIF